MFYTNVLPESVNTQNNKIWVRLLRGSIFQVVQKRDGFSICSSWKSGHWTPGKQAALGLKVQKLLLMMLHLRVTCVFLLLSLVSSVTAHPVKNEEEQDSFRTELRRPWSILGQDFDSDLVMEDELRPWLSSGLDRRRQLGDIEFSNRYSEFLRSKAKHTSMCAFLRRMQGVKKSGVGADTERVDLLLKQYMCPSILPWPADL